VELLVTLVVGIAWPVATVWVAYMFKGELKALVARISHLKYKEVEAKFEKGLAEAEAEVQKVERAAPPALPQPERLSQLDQLRRIAEVSPRAAIMEAWVLIETAASASGFVSDVAMSRAHPQLLTEHLARSGKIPVESITLMLKLRHLRNQAAHLPDFALSQDEAERYLELAVKISEIIGSAGNAS
jgi:hypothetical protein